MMDSGTRLRLEDMLRYAQAAVSILGGADSVALKDNLEKTLAIARAVEIVGEAANAIPQATRGTLSLPWHQMIAMRHRLIHGYGSIDLGILVDTVRNDLPLLIAEVERILSAN